MESNSSQNSCSQPDWASLRTKSLMAGYSSNYSTEYLYLFRLNVITIKIVLVSSGSVRSFIKCISNWAIIHGLSIKENSIKKSTEISLGGFPGII